MGFSIIFTIALFPHGKQVAAFVKQVVKLPRQRNLFLPGQTGLKIFNGVSSMAVLDLRLSFVDAVVATTTKQKTIHGGSQSRGTECVCPHRTGIRAEVHSLTGLYV